MSLLYHFLTWFFKRLYHELAWTYDWVAAIVSVGQWKAWVNSIIPLIDGEPILELGPGPGHLQKCLRKQHRQTFAIEESWQMIRLLSQKTGPSNPANTIRGNGEQLPFKSNYFRCVIATFPTNYIFYPQTLAGITRVLQPQGKCIILVSANFNGQKMKLKFLRWLYAVTGQSAPQSGMPDDILQAFQAAGLSVTEKWVGNSGVNLLFLVAERV